MNDFSELEKELRKLRPAPPSPVLLERVEQALENCRTGTSYARQPTRLPYNWWSLGFGLAAAAVLISFAVITIERSQERRDTVAQTSRAPEIRPTLRETGQPSALGRFVPVGGTNVVYNARDEGLHFADNSARPVRRLRYETQQTWRWRNPETGASLRVSYPSEEIVLIPLSGQ
jgi:hypothetical protein